MNLEHAHVSHGVLSGKARVPGTCGELVQGQFSGGRDFLVTLPVNLYSEAQVELTSGPAFVQVKPPHKVKTHDAVQAALAHLGQSETKAIVRISSQLPEGKGMASSSADIVAAARATASAFDLSLTETEISLIARAIEPTDGVMYADCVCYDHRNCRLIERLGPLPPLHILVVDLSGSVDTLAFNTRRKAYTANELDNIARAYQLVAAGIRNNNLHQIGEGATLSARINQRLLPKPQLEDVIAIAQNCGAYGVNVAHSGTIIGVLFDPDAGHAPDRAQAALAQRLDSPLRFFRVRTLNESETIP